jgi:hypothetical protein
MPRHPEKEAAERPSTRAGEVLGPSSGEGMNEESPGVVTLGIGSRPLLIEEGHEPAAPPRLRGLLPVPPEVEAEVQSQEAKHPMTPEYRRLLRDRLTLAHYFSDVEVAFRRTPDGIEVLAAGLNEIADFRRASTGEERQGIVYGVG